MWVCNHVSDLIFQSHKERNQSGPLSFKGQSKGQSSLCPRKQLRCAFITICPK